MEYPGLRLLHVIMQCEEGEYGKNHREGITLFDPSVLLMNLHTANGHRTTGSAFFLQQFITDLNPTRKQCQTFHIMVKQESSLNPLQESMRMRTLVSSTDSYTNTAAEPGMSYVRIWDLMASKYFSQPPIPSSFIPPLVSLGWIISDPPTPTPSYSYHSYAL